MISATYNTESGITGEDGEIDVDSTSDSEQIGTSQTQGNKSDDKQIIIEGLDSGTVVGIAFAAFIIGVLMMGILWFIHTHSGSSKSIFSCYCNIIKAIPSVFMSPNRRGLGHIVFVLIVSVLV